MNPHLLHVVDKPIVDSLEANRPEFEKFRHVIGSAVDVRIPEDEQRAHLRAVDQHHLGLQDRDAGRLRADQRTCDVETAFGEKLVKVVTGDPPGNIRIPCANEIGVSVAQLEQRGVNLPAPSTRRDDLAQLIVRRAADPHSQPVIEVTISIRWVLSEVRAPGP